MLSKAQGLCRAIHKGAGIHKGGGNLNAQN